jgi:hypothetical protein
MAARLYLCPALTAASGWKKKNNKKQQQQEELTMCFEYNNQPVTVVST